MQRVAQCGTVPVREGTVARGSTLNPQQRPQNTLLSLNGLCRPANCVACPQNADRCGASSCLPHCRRRMAFLPVPSHIALARDRRRAEGLHRCCCAGVLLCIEVEQTADLIAAPRVRVSAPPSCAARRHRRQSARAAPKTPQPRGGTGDYPKSEAASGDSSIKALYGGATDSDLSQTSLQGMAGVEQHSSSWTSHALQLRLCAPRRSSAAPARRSQATG